MAVRRKEFMKWLERHLGRYAISDLSRIICILYGAGWVLRLVNPDFLDYLTLNPYHILHGQVYRLITWLVVPQSSTNIFYVLIAMMFYYSIGTSLERTWGTVRYNIYILGGVLFTIIGAFIAYGVSYVLYGAPALEMMSMFISYYFTTYYILTSIFLAYAATFPDAVVLFMFILPLKVKWLGVLYVLDLAYTIYQYATSPYMSGLVWILCAAMAASLLNFLVFFLMTRDWARYSPNEVRRKNAWKRGTQGKTVNGRWRAVPGSQNVAGQTPAGKAAGPVHMKGTQSLHKCAICGRTEVTNPDLEFRYCSKCEGGYEYCQDHLFTHIHARNGSAPTLMMGDDITITNTPEN